MKKFRRLIPVILLGCILGIHNGCVALWRGTEPDPFWVSPYRAESLPEADQAALKQGIPVHSREELAQLLEDFLS